MKFANSVRCCSVLGMWHWGAAAQSQSPTRLININGGHSPGERASGNAVQSNIHSINQIKLKYSGFSLVEVTKLCIEVSPRLDWPPGAPRWWRCRAAWPPRPAAPSRCRWAAGPARAGTPAGDEWSYFIFNLTKNSGPLNVECYLATVLPGGRRGRRSWVLRRAGGAGLPRPPSRWWPRPPASPAPPQPSGVWKYRD